MRGCNCHALLDSVFEEQLLWFVSASRCTLQLLLLSCALMLFAVIIFIRARSPTVLVHVEIESAIDQTRLHCCGNRLTVVFVAVAV